MNSFLTNARAVHGSRYDYSQVRYVNARTKVTIICKEHGPFEQTPDKHVNSSQGCPACSGRTALDFAEFKKRAIAVHGQKYQYSRDSYVGYGKDARIVCRVHGPFHQRASLHVSGSGCPKCNGGVAATFAEFRERVRSRFGHVRLRNYKIGSVEVYCAKHGWAVSHPNYLLKRRHACSLCAREIAGIKRNQQAKQQYIDKAQNAHGSVYDYSSVDYVNAKTKITVICKKHGPFQQAPSMHISRKQGCPKCVHHVSRIERGVAKWLARYTEVVQSDRKLLCPQELDLVLPEHHLALEVNGLFWHNEQAKTPSYHYDKWKACSDKGYQLLQFWEHELRERPALCKSMIKQRLELNQRIGARKLRLCELSSAEAREFFNDTHLQGFRNASRYFALCDGDAIYAAMSFGRPLKRTHEWEIVRYSCAIGYTVVGGASRLLAHFERAVKPKSLLTFADLRISNGALYRKLGFDYLRTSAPNYGWQYGGCYLPRYRTQKHKLPKLLGSNFDPSESEIQNMQRCGYRRVFDAGNLVFEKRY